MSSNHPDPAKNQKPEKTDNRWEKGLFSKFWIRFYLFILFGFLISIIFTNKYQPVEISWLEFRKSMLQHEEVEKIEVINLEIAEVYIKEEHLSKEKHHKVAETPFSKEVNPGPHYKFNIGSVEIFEKNLAEIQAIKPSDDWVEVNYRSKTNWWQGIWVWIFPILLILVFWNLMQGSGRLKGRNMLNFGSSHRLGIRR